MKAMKYKLGFSLIELSIVILIIGILVLGVTQGARIISASKLRSAQSLTAGSPVNSSNNIIVWYDAAADKSFAESEKSNGGTISTWNDISPQSAGNNATQNTSANKPVYVSKGINGLPSVEFSGNQYFTFDCSRIANGNYTVFAVEFPRTGEINVFIGGNTAVTNQNLGLGTVEGTVIFSQYANDVFATISSYSAPAPRLHTFRFNSAIGKNYYYNGQQLSLSGGGSVVLTNGITSFTDAQIGRYTSAETVYYNGKIGEIIIFNRYLSDTERRAIEQYLGQKWGIKLQ